MRADGGGPYYHGKVANQEAYSEGCISPDVNCGLDTPVWDSPEDLTTADTRKPTGQCALQLEQPRPCLARIIQPLQGLEASQNTHHMSTSLRYQGIMPRCPPLFLSQAIEGSECLHQVEHMGLSISGPRTLRVSNLTSTVMLLPFTAGSYPASLCKHMAPLPQCWCRPT